MGVHTDNKIGLAKEAKNSDGQAMTMLYIFMERLSHILMIPVLV
jgi:hypothetical protein